MRGEPFESATLADGSVLRAQLAPSGELVVRRGAHEVRCGRRERIAGGRFVVSANQRRAVLSLRSGRDEEGFEVLDLRDGLAVTSSGAYVPGAFSDYAFSADASVLVVITLAPRYAELIEAFAKLQVVQCDTDARVTRTMRLRVPADATPIAWEPALGLKISSEGAVTFALPWAAQTIPLMPVPPAELVFDVPRPAQASPPRAPTRPFAAALAAHPAPARLGDVSLRYEPSMLIAETDKPRRSARPSLAWTGGFALLLFSVAALLLPEGAWLAAMLLVLGGLGIAFAVRLERHEKRQRRFVVNFATCSLRLDFSSPFAGMPKTLVVPFDEVKDVQLVDAGAMQVLVVDFLRGGTRLQEALVAFIPEAQRTDAERLQRVLHGAFGLGEVPADSPLHGYGEASSFE